MRIGVVGAGHIGSLLARSFVGAGHHVSLANSRGAETLWELCNSIDCCAASVDEVFASSEVVILAVPLGRIPELASAARLSPPATVFIDATNYGPFRDGTIDDLEAGVPESDWVGQTLGRVVAKAWNTVLAATLETRGRNPGEAGRLAIPVSGDDQATIDLTMTLVEGTGFDAVYAGSIADSWRLHPGAPIYCTELTASDVPKALAATDRSRSAASRDELITNVFTGLVNPTREQVVALIRSTTLPGTGLPSV